MSHETNEAIVLDLIHNQSHYKNLVSDLTDQLPKLLENEDPVFHQDIKNNYYDLCKSRMAEEIVKRLNVTPEDSLIVVQGLNLDEYFK